jgi:hypothetical protein
MQLDLVPINRRAEIMLAFLMHKFRVDLLDPFFTRVCLVHRTCRKIQGQCCGFRGFHNLVTPLASHYE